MIKVVAHTSSSDELARIVSAPVFVDVCSAVTELIAAVETQRQERVTKVSVLDVRAPESSSFQEPVLVNIGGKIVHFPAPEVCGAQQNTLEQPCWSHVPVAPVRCAGIWARAPLRLRGSGTLDGAGEDAPQRCVCAQREPVRSRAPHAHRQGHALTFGGRGTDPNH